MLVLDLSQNNIVFMLLYYCISDNHESNYHLIINDSDCMKNEVVNDWPSFGCQSSQKFNSIIFFSIQFYLHHHLIRKITVVTMTVGQEQFHEVNKMNTLPHFFYLW